MKPVVLNIAKIQDQVWGRVYEQLGSIVRDKVWIYIYRIPVNHKVKIQYPLADNLKEKIR